MRARPVTSRNDSVVRSVVTPSFSYSSVVSTASASGHPSNNQVATVRAGGSTSTYVPRNEHSVPSGVTKTMWYIPPTRRSISHFVTRSSNGANHLLTCSGFVSTSKTSSTGASNSRIVTTSKSLVYSTTADPCRFGLTACLLVVVVAR